MSSFGGIGLEGGRRGMVSSTAPLDPIPLLLRSELTTFFKRFFFGFDAQELIEVTGSFAGVPVGLGLRSVNANDISSHRHAQSVATLRGSGKRVGVKKLLMS